MGIDLTRVKGLCFDLDGTLSDTDDMWVSRLTGIFSRAPFLFRNRDPKPAARKLVMNAESPMNSVYMLLDRFSLDDQFAALYNRVSQRKSSKKSQFWLINGAKKVLETLSSSYPITIVSARDHFSTMRFVEQFDLASYFKNVVTAQTCEYTKPFPHPIRYAANSMGLPTEACVMIGDTTVDILAGKAAGAQTIGLLCGFGTESELRSAGADLILPGLIDILPIFFPEPLMVPGTKGQL
jgi:HAD superfamily hydrolase (TIGR01549 family)